MTESKSPKEFRPQEKDSKRDTNPDYHEGSPGREQDKQRFAKGDDDRRYSTPGVNKKK